MTLKYYSNLSNVHIVAKFRCIKVETVAVYFQFANSNEKAEQNNVSHRRSLMHKLRRSDHHFL